MAEPVRRQPRSLAPIFLIGVFLMVVISISLGQLNDGLLARDSMVPDATFERFSGPAVSLTSERGHVVVLDFWASWCPPCREELPMLTKLGAEYEAAGVHFIAANDEGEDLAYAKEAVAMTIRGLPGLAPFAAYSRPEFKQLFAVHALPTLYVIDRSGKIVAAAVGSRSESDVREWITAALAAK